MQDSVSRGTMQDNAKQYRTVLDSAGQWRTTLNSARQSETVQKPNSWTYNFVEVSGHNLESSHPQTFEENTQRVFCRTWRICRSTLKRAYPISRNFRPEKKNSDHKSPLKTWPNGQKIIRYCPFNESLSSSRLRIQTQVFRNQKFIKKTSRFSSYLFKDA